MPLMFTTRLGVARYSFMRLIRSVPPASTSASPHLLSSNPRASCSVVGFAYSKACILCIPPFERFKHPVGSQRDIRYAYADGIGHCVRDRRDGRNRRRLAQADHPTLIVLRRHVNVGHDFT